MSDHSKCMRKLASVLAGALLLLAAPLGVLYFESLRNLPLGLRVSVTTTVLIVLLAGVLLLARYMSQLGILTVFFILAVSVASMLVMASRCDGQPAPNSASILYSDGSLVSGVPPADTNLWGRELSTYGLHPRYDSVRVPETLIAHLRPSTKAIRVLVSKPRDAMVLADGSPTDSDGITLDMLAKGQDGQILARRLANITREAFLEHRWITLELAAPSAIAEIAIKVTPGPPGSTPTYDSTLLAIQAGGFRSTLFAAGKIALSGLSAFVLALSGAGILAFLAASVNPGRWHFQGRLTWSPLIFGASLLAVVYWSASHTHFIFYWDYRNYWEKTEQLFELIMSGSWVALGNAIFQSYSDDYTMFPALPTAIFAVPIGYPSRLLYVLSISLIYVIPAFLTTAYIADRIFVRAGEITRDRGTLRLASAFAVFFGVPLYLGVALNLMPDIGGVVITLAAMLLACRLSRTIGCAIGRTNPWGLTPELVNESIGLGILLSAMFLFRRWYVFLGAGIVLAGLLILGYDLLRERPQRFDVLRSAVSATVLIATAALPILSWVMFDWASAAASHDYASLYAAYAYPLSAVRDLFLHQFGIVAPVLTILLLGLSLFLKVDRRLLFIVAAASIVGALLFLQVQSPGPQHYYILMPLLGVGVAGISSLLTSYYGPTWGFAFAGVLLFGTLGATVQSRYRDQFVRAFPTLNSWMPKQQAGRQGLALLGDWLVSPDIKLSRFCVLASSGMINQSIVSELWQIIPSLDKQELAHRIIWLGDVDSRDGPPSRALTQCEIVLVGTPPQTHLGVQKQYSVVVPWQDLISGGGIGAAYERLPNSFRLDDQTEVVPFRRVRPLEEREYQDLVRRFCEVSGRRGLSKVLDCGSKPLTE